jgi:hypothetical protein
MAGISQQRPWQVEAAVLQIFSFGGASQVRSRDF